MPLPNRACLRRWILAVLLAAVATGGRTLCGDERFEPVRQRVQRALTDTPLPSIAVAVAHDGQIVWEEGFGWADRENRVPADAHTMYSLASISKPFTATGLMVLVERGQIDLDKPIDDYLGEAKLRARVGTAAEATVRRVANHTAGLPLHYQFFYADESFRPPSRDETIRRYANLVTAPGERFQYSNLGYGILDYVIERTSGQAYEDFMREEVFLPLGLTHTSVGLPARLEPHQAIRYTPDGKPIPFYEFDHPGASAIYSSAHDLVRFAMFHLQEHLPDQRSILKDALLSAMQTPATTSRSGSGYGIGWGTFTDTRGYACVQHTGGMPGVSTICRLVPAERLAVVVLANGRSGLPDRLVEMITEIMLPEDKAAADKPQDGDDDAPAESPFVPSAELLGVWRGKLATYQGEQRLVLDVKDSGDVHVRLDRQLLTLLNDVSFRDGMLRGRFASRVNYDDNRGRPYSVLLELKLRDGVLNGSATTMTLPDAWGSSAVTHWVELEHRSDAQ